jgi:hypothetical protein
MSTHLWTRQSNHRLAAPELVIHPGEEIEQMIRLRARRLASQDLAPVSLPRLDELLNVNFGEVHRGTLTWASVLRTKECGG